MSRRLRSQERRSTPWSAERLADSLTNRATHRVHREGPLSRVRPSSRLPALQSIDTAGSGDRPPLIYLHVWAEDVGVARVLADGLTDRQVISLPRPPLADGRAPARYDDWVAHYARLIDDLGFGEDEPLYLAGWSQGFLFSVDVARHRAQFAKPTSVIISLDSSVPWIERDLRRFAHVIGRQPSWRRRFLVTWREVVMPGVRALRALLLRSVPPTWSATKRERHPTSSFWQASDPYLSAVFLANSRHSTHYGQCGVDTIVVASEKTRARAIDDDLGWHELLTGRIDVVSVPGGHWTFLSDENAPTTIQRLDAALLGADDRLMP